jgi:small nuclear ribonucleoprotein (snRNP)-like protein
MAKFDSSQLERMIGETVVLDVAAPFVYLGTLQSFNSSFLVLADADVHDLRDSESTRELYLLSSARDGVRRNRRHVTVRWDTVLSLSTLDDIVDH